MTAMIDMTGKRFNNLYVLGREGKSIMGLATWRCVCICGKHCIRDGSELRRGKINSCGCTRVKRNHKKLLPAASPST